MSVGEKAMVELGTAFKTGVKCSRWEDGVHRVGFILTNPYIEHRCMCGQELWPNGRIVGGQEGESDDTA